LHYPPVAGGAIAERRHRLVTCWNGHIVKREARADKSLAPPASSVLKTPMPQPLLLLVEDNDLDAMLLERLFEHTGSAFRLVRVPHGEAAIAYLAGTGEFADRAKYPLPNLMLLDLKMPRMDGFAVLRWRQEKNPAFAGVPVVVFSSSDLADDVARAYALGANSYVVKPSDPLKLERFVGMMQMWWAGLNVTAPRT
jgi:CheY-like chemotaxis protein